MPRSKKVYIVMRNNGPILAVFDSSSKAHTYRRNRNKHDSEPCTVVGPFNVE